MLLRTACFALIASLVVSFSSVVADDNESTAEDFGDFITAFEGRWIGDVTFVMDQTDRKRGQRVQAQFEGHATDSGRTYLGKFYGGEGTATWMVYYNAGAKQIQSTWVTSGGLVSTGVMTKTADGNWEAKFVGSDADGRRTETTESVLVTQSGQKHTWQGTGTVGGKPMEKIHNTWQRASP